MLPVSGPCVGGGEVGGGDVGGGDVGGGDVGGGDVGGGEVGGGEVGGGLFCAEGLAAPHGDDDGAALPFPAEALDEGAPELP